MRGSGNQTTWNGWRTLAAASSTLAEASSNAAVNLSSRSVNVTIVSYGRSVKITDLAELTSIIGPVEGAVRELSQSARLTLDNVVQRAVYKDVLAEVGQNADTKTQLLSAWLAGQPSSFNTDTGATGTQTGGSAIARSRTFGFPVVFGTSATRLSAQTALSISSTPGPILLRKMSARLKRLNVEPKSNGAYVAVTHPNWINAVHLTGNC